MNLFKVSPENIFFIHKQQQQQQQQKSIKFNQFILHLFVYFY